MSNCKDCKDYVEYGDPCMKCTRGYVKAPIRTGETDKAKHMYINELGYVVTDNMKTIENEPLENLNENAIKPSHYKAGEFDVIAFCQKHDLNFDVGNVIKYVTRAGKKKDNSELQDLNKAMEYLKRRIEFIKGASNENK